MLLALVFFRVGGSNPFYFGDCAIFFPCHRGLAFYMWEMVLFPLRQPCKHLFPPLPSNVPVWKRDFVSALRFSSSPAGLNRSSPPCLIMFQNFPVFKLQLPLIRTPGVFFSSKPACVFRLGGRFPRCLPWPILGEASPGSCRHCSLLPSFLLFSFIVAAVLGCFPFCAKTARFFWFVTLVSCRTIFFFQGADANALSLVPPFWRRAFAPGTQILFPLYWSAHLCLCHRQSPDLPFSRGCSAVFKNRFAKEERIGAFIFFSSFFALSKYTLYAYLDFPTVMGAIYLCVKSSPLLAVLLSSHE